MQLNSWDWSIIIFYFAISLIIGLIYTRRAGQNTEEFFISGRSLPWWLVGTSMVATTFSSDTPNLVTDMVRNYGVCGNWMWWAFLLTGMFTVFLYAKLWRRSAALTDIAFYELRYSGKAAAFLRGFRALYLGVFFNVVIMAAVTLSAVKISSILLGMDRYATVLTCLVITALYSCFSGLWGVMVTDLFQFVVAMIGAVAAAYYSLAHPAVGGLSKLLSRPELTEKLQIFPDFSRSDIAITVFVIPFAVQWWSTWYPGAEPGGGGYIAQRMLSSKDEKNSLLATLWFNIAHYAIRPWPWIIVGLCSLMVFPELKDIQKQFPQLEANAIPLRHDLGYPAMLVFLPHGIMGLMIASLAAAYMSTIATHLNWGSSYVIEDFYKRFVRLNASPKHYVAAARLTTMGLMILACIVSFWLQNSLQAFNIMLQIGAGTGLIYMLRWFWWRINAWTEISAMISSFFIAFYFEFIHRIIPAGMVLTDWENRLTALDPFPIAQGYPVLESWQRLVVGVGITTLVWLVVTYLSPKTQPQVLQSFYDKIHPLGPGWRRVVQRGEAAHRENVTAAIYSIFLGCITVYTALFATGYFLYGKLGLAVGLTAVCLVSLYGILKLLPQIGWRE